MIEVGAENIAVRQVLLIENGFRVLQQVLLKLHSI